MHAGIHARRRATACLVPCVLTIALLFSGHASAQNVFDFDAIAAQDELDRITEMLGREEVGNEELSNANTRVIRIESAAANCVNAATEARLRREERFEPFKDPDDMVADAQFMAQRNELRAAIDEAISAQARCESIAGHALALATSITSRQNLLSQQFLSSRADNIVELIAEFPARAATWPGQLRKSFELRLRENVEPIHVFWLIIAAGLIAALAGVLLRQFFRAWYFRDGGDDAKPRLRYLLPKPVAEFAPLWLTGLAFAAVLHATVVEPDGSMLVIRLAYAILIFGAASIVINWATGPLSPSAQVKGLIPDHVVPLRLRLRLVFLTISASYVVLGSQWLSVRIAETYVSGRASMIFLVGVAFLVLFAYLPRIPGVQGRYRVLRVLAIVAITASIVTVLFGYQNFAAFLIANHLEKHLPAG
ncbi:MAG: hypothetical protein ACE5F8_06425, partial [Woeseiaceae bacterium]